MLFACPRRRHTFSSPVDTCASVRTVPNRRPVPSAVRNAVVECFECTGRDSFFKKNLLDKFNDFGSEKIRIGLKSYDIDLSLCMIQESITINILNYKNEGYLFTVIKI